MVRVGSEGGSPPAKTVRRQQHACRLCLLVFSVYVICLRFYACVLSQVCLSSSWLSPHVRQFVFLFPPVGDFRRLPHWPPSSTTTSQTTQPGSHRRAGGWTPSCGLCVYPSLSASLFLSLSVCVSLSLPICLVSVCVFSVVEEGADHPFPSLPFPPHPVGVGGDVHSPPLLVSVVRLDCVMCVIGFARERGTLWTEATTAWRLSSCLWPSRRDIRTA